MTKRALVLGGGGSVGIAWETGVAAGLADGGVDVQTADLFVGTSAGSVVGSMLAYGLDPRQLLALQAAMGGQNQAQNDLAPKDPQALMAVMGMLMNAQELNLEMRRELGAMALQAETMPEEVWVGYMGRLLGGQTEWPERRLMLTAVDAANGEFEVWDRYSSVPLYVAVASSCTVPGLFPPVSINGKRYMDGGMRSGTNADLAKGHDAVLVVAPMGAEVHGFAYRALVREIEDLRQAGAAVAAIQPDLAALKAFGPNMMDASRVAEAAAEGERQGREAAERVKAMWA
jgi:NTE family protein